MRAEKANTMKHDCFVSMTEQSGHKMSYMHYHDFYEIYIQNQSYREHLVNNTFYRLNPGDILLLKPSVLHQSLSANAHVRTVIYFSPHYLQQYYSTDLIRQLLQIFDYEYLTLTSENYYAVMQVIREMRKTSNDDPYNLHFAKLAEILMLFSKNLHEHPPVHSNANILDTQHLQDPQVSPLIAYVHNNYLNLTNIEEIASTFYITPSHLCRTFKKLTGCTIVQYINLLKIQRACTLLHDTDLNITQIATSCGFNSAMYFCRIFKQLVKLTPVQYRTFSRNSVPLL